MSDNRYDAWSVAVSEMKEEILKEVEGMNFNFDDDGEETWHLTDFKVAGYGIDINVVFPESAIFGDGKLYITAYPCNDYDTDRTHWVQLGAEHE